MTRHMLVVLAVLACATASAEPPPISAFARRPAISMPSLSPDGRYVLYVTSLNGGTAAVTVDRRTNFRAVSVLQAGPQIDFDLEWCGWADAKRILCGYRSVAHARYLEREARLIAVNADGSDRTILSNWSGTVAVSVFLTGLAPIQDRVIDFSPGPQGKVLLQLATAGTPYPAVIELDVYSGRTRMYEDSEPPIREYGGDGGGNVRLGWGVRDGKVSSYYRLSGERFWREWGKPDVTPDESELLLLQAIRGSNSALATGPLDGREAAWKVDLQRHKPAEVVFAHPSVDISKLLVSRDQRLVGVQFETEKPATHYVDARVASLIVGVDRLLPDAYNEVIDTSVDGKVFLIRSRSDVDGGSYYMIDASTGSGELEFLGTSYPELDRSQLPRMQSIKFSAGFGVEIPGYLTLPAGGGTAKPPLVVLVHDGPDQRDSWSFDYLRHFLVSRGYAVLQANFRGSRGYGREWLDAANGDWSGLPVADIRHAAKWAVTQGIADASQICIMGRGFGGYAAFLAVRDAEQFRCAVSINGIADLRDYMAEIASVAERSITERRIGTDKPKLESDSATQNAARMPVPVLLVHGTHDRSVNVTQSKRLADALKRAGKAHELVIIEGAGHELQRESDRASLLSAIEKFLAVHLK